MSTFRIQPHRQASAMAVRWGSWLMSLDKSDWVSVPDRIQGWDYQSVLAFELRLGIRTVDLRESTGIDNQESIRAVIMIDCKATNRRFIEQVSLPSSDDPEVVLQLQVPSEELAGSLNLSSYLVLGREVEVLAQGCASKVGSRLAENPPITVTLEGDGSRFPTEGVSFKALGYESALWTLRVGVDDMDAGFASCIRLLVNTDLAESTGLLGGARDPLLLGFLRIDIARHIATTILRLDVPVADLMAEREEGSFGAEAQHLLGWALGSDLATTMTIAKTDYPRFERMLQDSFFPRSVS